MPIKQDRKGRLAQQRRNRTRRFTRNRVTRSQLQAAKRAAMMTAETKYKDRSFNGLVSNLGQFYVLNGVAQGDTVTTRDGNSIRMKSINVRSFVNHASAGPAEQYVRTVIFVDTQADTIAPDIDEIFTTNASVDSFRNMNNTKRFRIYRDDVVYVSSQNPIARRTYNIKSTLPVKYLGTSDTLNDIASNSVYILQYSNASGADVPNAQYTARVKFVDY